MLPHDIHPPSNPPTEIESRIVDGTEMNVGVGRGDGGGDCIGGNQGEEFSVGGGGWTNAHALPIRINPIMKRDCLRSFPVGAARVQATARSGAIRRENINGILSLHGCLWWGEGGGGERRPVVD